MFRLIGLKILGKSSYRKSKILALTKIKNDSLKYKTQKYHKFYPWNCVVMNLSWSLSLWLLSKKLVGIFEIWKCHFEFELFCLCKYFQFYTIFDLIKVKSSLSRTIFTLASWFKWKRSKLWSTEILKYSTTVVNIYVQWESLFEWCLHSRSSSLSPCLCVCA